MLAWSNAFQVLNLGRLRTPVAMAGLAQIASGAWARG